jgi:hypothetical protein
MSKIASFNPAALSAIRADMAAALAAVEAKYGIKIGLGKINYTDSDFTCKMTTMIADMVAEATADGAKVDPKWVADFNRSYFAFGLKKEDLGRVIKYQGRDLKLVGTRSRANMPLVVQEVGTPNFKTFSVEAWQRATK